MKTSYRLQELLRQAAVRHVSDVTEVEIDAIYSTFRTSLGLRALRIAQEARRNQQRVAVDEFSSHDGFDFAELPKPALISQLDAGSGLGREACAALLGDIEALLLEHLTRTLELEIEGLGRLKKSDSHGFTLLLADDLRVPAPAFSYVFQ